MSYGKDFAALYNRRWQFWGRKMWPFLDKLVRRENPRRRRLTGVPCWACLGSQRMARVDIPDCVRELHIFADADEPGRLAAEQTARAHPQRRVIVHLPPDGFGDYADLAADLAKSEVAA